MRTEGRVWGEGPCPGDGDGGVEEVELLGLAGEEEGVDGIPVDAVDADDGRRGEERIGGVELDMDEGVASVDGEVGGVECYGPAVVDAFIDIRLVGADNDVVR